ncbi:hypothetical protein EDEG_03797, partial [Edhazardia aedis USNM 41457]
MQISIYVAALLRSLNSSPDPKENTLITSKTGSNDHVSEPESADICNNDPYADEFKILCKRIDEYEQTLLNIKKYIEKHLYGELQTSQDEVTVSENDLKILLEILTELYFRVNLKEKPEEIFPEHDYSHLIELLFINTIKLHTAFESQEKFTAWI